MRMLGCKVESAERRRCQAPHRPPSTSPARPPRRGGLCKFIEEEIVKRVLFIAVVSAVISMWGIESAAPQERIVYEIDKSNHAEWYLHGMKCTQVSKIRVHGTPQWAPYAEPSCMEASGNRRIGIAPGQWVEIKLVRNGSWYLLEEADRRP